MGIPRSTRRLLVRDDAMFGTAQLPKFRQDQFAVGTTEVIEFGDSGIDIAIQESFNDLRDRQAAGELDLARGEKP